MIETLTVLLFVVIVAGAAGWMKVGFLRMELEDEDEASEVAFQCLAEKRKELNLLRPYARKLEELILRAYPYVEFDAMMAGDFTRHAPLDSQSQAIHDSTETESEKLLKEISDTLGPLLVYYAESRHPEIADPEIAFGHVEGGGPFEIVEVTDNSDLEEDYDAEEQAFQDWINGEIDHPRNDIC